MAAEGWEAEACGEVEEEEATAKRGGRRAAAAGVHSSGARRLRLEAPHLGNSANAGAGTAFSRACSSCHSSCLLLELEKTHG